MITMTAREFNQDTSRAKKSALSKPVIITDRGKPSHVLLSMSQYETLLTQSRGPEAHVTPGDLLSLPSDTSFETDAFRLNLKVPNLED